MSEKVREELLNPETYFVGDITIIDMVAAPVPPGTKAPPRPYGRERMPWTELPIVEPFVIFESQPIAIPPGTTAPPRKPSP